MPLNIQMNKLTDQFAKDITLKYLIAVYGKKRGIVLFKESQNHLFDYQLSLNNFL